MKRIILILLLALAAMAQTSVWDGTINTSWYNSLQTEFTITTAEQLAGLAELVNNGNNFEGKIIKLGSDIMLNDTTNWQNWETNPPAREWMGIGYDDNINNSSFAGTFDGCSYIVSGVYINTTKNCQGLFGYIVGEAVGNHYATIKNLGIVSSYVSGKTCVGLLIGEIENGKIINCYTSGKVKGSGHAIGGLAGYVVESYITNSYSTADAEGVSVEGSWKVGGLVGDFTCATIDNCYATGNVRGHYFVGGLLGSAYGTIANSYAVGNVSGTIEVGGLIGDNENGIIITNSYYDSQTSGQNDDDGRGEPKTTTQMKQQSTFADWDFTNIWAISSDKNKGYPYLDLRGGGTPVIDIQKSDSRYGIKFVKNIVSENAEMNIILPNNEKAAETKFVVYDMTGNVVFATTQREDKIVWNLTNNAGRFVANGSYLVVAEVKSVNGKPYHYSAKLGVRR